MGDWIDLVGVAGASVQVEDGVPVRLCFDDGADLDQLAIAVEQQFDVCIAPLSGHDVNPTEVADRGVIRIHVVPEACCYDDCERAATTHDCDGDFACELHAAQSESYVIVATLDGAHDFWTTAGARAAEALLAERGWTVSIRPPRTHSEAEGTYLRRADGSLQILGYSIPRPAALDDAIHAASQAAIDAAAPA